MKFFASNASADGFDIKTINRLALPAILMGVAEPVISLVDTAFVGRIGTTELAAVGIAGGFYLMTVWILAQTLTAIAAIVSRHYGKGTLDEVQSLVPQAFWSNVLLGVGFLVLTTTFSTTIFTFYNASGEVLEGCERYFGIRAYGFPFTLGTFLLFGTFRGLQNTSWAMWISITGAATNVVLDYLLIFGVGDTIPAMGLEGAAWASLSAQVLMCGLAVGTVLGKTTFGMLPGLPINPHFRWLAGMSGDLFIRTVLLNLTFYLATRYATGYGDEVIAAHTIALNIWLFSSFFIDGYALAGNAIAGRLLGSDNIASLRKLGAITEKISVGIGAGLGIIYALLYPMMAGFFTKDPEVVQAFDAVFWLVILSQPINAIAFSYDGIYKGLALVKPLRNLLAVATLFGFIPVLVLFHYTSPGLLGIWVGFLVWMAVRSSWLAWDFRRRYAHPASITL